MKPRLLVVDDEPELTDSLRDILEDAGYAVYTASTASKGFEELMRSPMDLVLLDYNLPDGKGVEWADRYHERQPELKILLMTGMSEHDLPDTGNVEGIIPKPIAPPDLLERIRQALL